MKKLWKSLGRIWDDWLPEIIIVGILVGVIVFMVTYKPKVETTGYYYESLRSW